MLQVIALLVSELVSNVVRHADARTVDVRYEILPSHVRIEVADEGPGFEARPQPQRPGQVNGWGLHLVDELSSRWGLIHGDGCHVWFELDR